MGDEMDRIISLRVKYSLLGVPENVYIDNSLKEMEERLRGSLKNKG
jgi:hypothetical protein